MTNYIHMQDQVRNRIEALMEDDQNWVELDDFAQTLVTLVIVFVFMAFGLNW